MWTSPDHEPLAYTTQSESFPGSFLEKGHELLLHVRPRVYLGTDLHFLVGWLSVPVAPVFVRVMNFFCKWACRFGAKAFKACAHWCGVEKFFPALVELQPLATFEGY